MEEKNRSLQQKNQSLQDCLLEQHHNLFVHLQSIVPNIAQRDLHPKQPADPLQKERYLLAMEEYAAKVCSQDDL